MPSLYVCVYLARRANGTQGTPVARAFEAANDWPYDVGDDPAFFAARHLRGPVTWGVCRPEVRNAIQPQDVVAFIAAEETRPRTRTYRFAALLEVERKVEQTALFTDGGLRLFQSYLNHLIRPCGHGWEHFEPALPETRWHGDWLWRLNSGAHMKKDVVAVGETHQPGASLAAAVAPNYVLFRQNNAIVAPFPVPIADHTRGTPYETWRPDAVATRLRDLLLGNLARGLRTSNRQQPHRHIRRSLPTDLAAWRSAVADCIGSAVSQAQPVAPQKLSTAKTC